jgi:hypothetical protein
VAPLATICHKKPHVSYLALKTGETNRLRAIVLRRPAQRIEETPVSETNTSPDQSISQSVNGIIDNFRQDILKAIQPLFDNVETMAGHVIVLEEVLKQVIASHPVDKAAVVAAIKHRISTGTEGRADPSRTLETLDDLIP